MLLAIFICPRTSPTMMNGLTAPQIIQPVARASDARPVYRRFWPFSASDPRRKSPWLQGLAAASVLQSGKNGENGRKRRRRALPRPDRLEHIPFGWNQPNGMCPVKQHRARAHFRADGTASGSICSEIALALLQNVEQHQAHRLGTGADGGLGHRR